MEILARVHQREMPHCRCSNMACVLFDRRYFCLHLVPFSKNNQRTKNKKQNKTWRQFDSTVCQCKTEIVTEWNVCICPDLRCFSFWNPFCVFLRSGGGLTKHSISQREEIWMQSLFLHKFWCLHVPKGTVCNDTHASHMGAARHVQAAGIKI